MIKNREKKSWADFRLGSFFAFPQGTSSKPQRHSGQTRRAAWCKEGRRRIPQRMNSKRRSASWSYPRAGRWQREQTAVELLRGRTVTSMLFLSALKWVCW